MRMPRVRFTVRGLMVAVAVTALVLGAAAALMPRRSRMPRDAFEALVYIRQQGSGFPDFDDIQVRKIRRASRVPIRRAVLRRLRQAGRPRLRARAPADLALRRRLLHAAEARARPARARVGPPVIHACF